MKMAIGCLLTSGLGATVAFVGAHFLPLDVTSAVLTAIGGIGALSTVGLVQVLTRRKDVLSLKPLTDWHQQKMESLLGRRHRRLIIKWISCFLAAVLTAAAGFLIRVPSTKTYQVYLVTGGFFLGSITVVLVFVILAEFYALHMLWEALRQKSIDHERETAFYQDKSA